MNYGYLVVEGPHDVAFIGRLLRRSGFTRIRMVDDLVPLWRPFTEVDYPYKGDLLRRIPVPVFYQNGEVAIALDSSIGDGNISSSLEYTLNFVGARSLSFIGVILDADSQHTPLVRFERLKTRLTYHVPIWPNAPGEVGAGTPRTGIYVLPDNENAGTLEDLLIESANTVWPETLLLARAYVEDAAQTLAGDDLTELNRPAGRPKAVAASLANLLRPGKSVQVSIEDNNWLTPETLQLPRIAALQTFLHQLIGLP